MLLAVLIAAAPAWTEPNSRELTASPFTARLGVYQARQYGFAGDFYFPLARSFAVTFRGQYDYAQLARDESDLCERTSCRAEVVSASPHGLLLSGAALFGFELHPELAAAEFYGLGPVLIDVVLGGALGAAATRRQLKPDNSVGPARFGDTGWRMTAQVGGGLRFRIASWVSVRTEIRALLMSSSIETVNGCTLTDLESMDAAIRSGASHATATVRSACSPTAFDALDLGIARNLVRSAGGHLLAIVQLHVGLGVTF